MDSFWFTTCKIKVKALAVAFYARNTLSVARELLGKVLVRETGGHLLVGRIMETEAYAGPGDPASHAARGPTPRSRIMFGRAGRAYVYLCYGVYFLLNVVTEKEEKAGAVLIRAISPLRGNEATPINRRRQTLPALLDGPGKVTREFRIDQRMNGWDLTRGEKLYIAEGTIVPPERIVRGPRVGIKDGRDRLWRFTLK